MISSAWEVTNVDNLREMQEERERGQAMSADAREVVNMIMGMDWEG